MTARTASPASITITQAKPNAVFRVGNHWTITKFASQLTLAHVAAARPRTSVGNTSPWMSQPVPPTPIANDEDEAREPDHDHPKTRATPSSSATPHAATSMKTAMPTNPPMASFRRPILSMKRKAK